MATPSKNTDEKLGGYTGAWVRLDDGSERTAASAGLVHENERRWPVFRGRVEQLVDSAEGRLARDPVADSDQGASGPGLDPAPHRASGAGALRLVLAWLALGPSVVRARRGVA